MSYTTITTISGWLILAAFVVLLYWYILKDKD